MGCQRRGRGEERGRGGRKFFSLRGGKKDAVNGSGKRGREGGRHKLFSLMGWEGQNLLSASQTSVYSTRKV